MTQYEAQKNAAVNEARERAEELINHLCELSNVLDDDIQQAVANGIADGLVRNHRTIQQSTVKNIGDALRMYSERAGTDPRNEDAIAWAKKVGEIDNLFRFI